MEIRLPQLGEGADTGTVVNILVKVGEPVKKNQTLIELESGKAVAPIPSTGDGTVQTLHIKQGDTISVGQLIATLSGSGSVSSGPAASPQPRVQAVQPVQSQAQTNFTSTPTQLPSGEYQYQSQSGFPPPASPSVRAMARDLGIDLGRVRGTENGGRIGLADLRNYFIQIQALAATNLGSPPQTQPPLSTPTLSVDFSKWGGVTKKPLTSLRRAIAKQMHDSWSTIPHVTQFDEADVTEISQLRKKYAPEYEKRGANLTLTAIIMKAVTSALKKHPVINSSLDLEKGELVLKGYIHLGVAVDTDQGLIVPVIRNADQKSVFDLALELGQLAEKTRQRKISGEELKGGTFTISNLGGIGGGHFTPIVNKPEVAILGIGRGIPKPVVKNGKVEIRSLMPVCVSYDHRVVDGADGARFTRDFIEALENISEADIKLGSTPSAQSRNKAVKKSVKKAGKK